MKLVELVELVGPVHVGLVVLVRPVPVGLVEVARLAALFELVAPGVLGPLTAALLPPIALEASGPLAVVPALVGEAGCHVDGIAVVIVVDDGHDGPHRAHNGRRTRQHRSRSQSCQPGRAPRGFATGLLVLQVGGGG